MPSFNEHFMHNVEGKTIDFAVQPYESGVGVIKSATPRMVKGITHCPHKGKMAIEYECYDLTVEVTEGRRVGALYGGVAVRGTIHDTANTTTQIVGVRYGELHAAAFKGERLVIARCG